MTEICPPGNVEPKQGLTVSATIEPRCWLQPVRLFQKTDVTLGLPGTIKPLGPVCIGEKKHGTPTPTRWLPQRKGTMMRGFRGVLAAGSLSAAALLAAVPSAGAATRSDKNATTYAVTCTNGATGAAVIKRRLVTHADRIHPKWFVAHIVGAKKGAKVFVPGAMAVTFTFTNSKGVVTTTTESIAKHGANHGQTVCAISGTNSVAGGTLTVSGSVTGVFH